MQNLDSGKLIPKSAKLTCYLILKFIIINKGQDRFNRYSEQVRFRTGEKNISTVWKCSTCDIGTYKWQKIRL